jgi:hypothetical protein
MKYSVNTTLIVGSDVSLDLVVSHPFQPTVEEVVVSMKSLTNPTLLFKGDKFEEVKLPMQS